MLTFCQKCDSWFAGQRRNHEKLIQAPLLTQNLKKFQTRWVITIIVSITINVIITIYMIIVSRSIFFRMIEKQKICELEHSVLGNNA